jgi:hypothetical protein
MTRSITAVSIVLAIIAPIVRAEDRPVASTETASIRGSVEKTRFSAPIASPFRPAPRGSKHNRTGHEASAGVALGVVGFFAGAALGSALDRDCHCDDPGLKGMVIAAPIGAIAGAIAGVWLASR